MNPDHPSLLDDLFEAGPATSRHDALLTTLLAGVRRQQRHRRMRRRVVTATAVMLAVVGLWQLVPERSEPGAVALTAPSPPVASSDPVAVEAAVPEPVVARGPAGVHIITSDPASVTIVRTGDLAGRWRELSDDDLLRLFEGQGAALVRSEGQAFVVAAGQRVGEQPPWEN
ncbi:MAG: hypothetical protein HS113_00625 [Verrucomicrobiales bacterium]|nr:hypothetical protein [Verrucomicrobiales bacterium]